MGQSAIRKILIVNRGEIAVRVIRACRELDIRSVAVYSDVDRLALHVQMADEAYHVGAAPSLDSYLDQRKLLAVARQAGADAVHPGYGFLAENPAFAERVVDEGYVFIGPPAEAMRLMGDKTVARQRMLEAHVPIVPGTDKPLGGETEAVEVAKSVGYPILLKAAAGGGGKGMRVVRNDQEMSSAFRAAKSEAESAFADGRVYLEKYLEAPRHIEFQILADRFGNVIHLGERECSIQRRHQKVIEEAPSSVLGPDLREEMGTAAVEAAKACGYENAGTIEFMLDQDLNFYFLEMNTRLQVEHPVTEMVTGLDLVKEQIWLAAGGKLERGQADVAFNGHAIESRIYAEDPANNFLPSTGKINSMVEPNGPGVRVDSGYYPGSEVTPYYDPLIAKLVTWGRDREEAIARMKRALWEFKIHGIDTSIPFCSLVMRHEKFVSGDFNTDFISQEFLAGGADLSASIGEDQNEDAMVALAAALFEMQFGNRGPQFAPDHPTTETHRWKQSGRMQNLRHS